MRAAVLALITGVATGCTSTPAYDCADNSQCIDDSGASGVCEADHFCSFPDTTCDKSGQRYASGAGNGEAGQCVDTSADACVTQVVVGVQFACFLRNDGTVWCWGNNADGEVGADVDSDSVAVPTQVSGLSNVVEISAAEEHACAVEHDGSVWCWGINDTLNLGQCDQSLTNTKTPLKVPKWTQGSGGPSCQSGQAFQAALPSGAVTNTLSAGGEHTCVIGADNQLYCWGENNTGGDDGGQAGQNPAQSGGMPNVPGPLVVSGVGTLGTVVDVQAGDEYTCALNSDNNVYCWGENDLGELATGDMTDSFTPVKIGGFGDVAQLAIDDETGCVVTKNGDDVFCWGNGSTGIFGPANNKSNNALSATNLTLAGAKLFGGPTSETLCLSTSAGALDCWGDNGFGQLGNGDLTTVDETTPTPALISSVAQMAIGDHHACALTRDGSLWCWGDNSVGELGNNATSTTAIAVPTRVAVTCH